MSWDTTACACSRVFTWLPPLEMAPWKKKNDLEEISWHITWYPTSNKTIENSLILKKTSTKQGKDFKKRVAVWSFMTHFIKISSFRSAPCQRGEESPAWPSFGPRPAPHRWRPILPKVERPELHQRLHRLISVTKIGLHLIHVEYYKKKNIKSQACLFECG